MKTHFKTLPNGLRVLMVPLKESASVTVGIFVGAGSAYEDASNNGISHFLEHMCFKGTDRRPTAMDISREMEGLGASYNAFTDRDMTGYYAKVAPKHFKKAYDIISDLYLHPTVDEKELEKEKGVIVEEIRMYQDDPRAALSDRVEREMYGDQPAGWNIAGTEKNVNGMTREHFMQYRKDHYIPNKTLVVIAGLFNEAEAMQMIRRDFGILQKGRIIGHKGFSYRPSGPRVAIVERKLDQSHVMLGFNAVRRDKEELYAISMMARVLGGGMSSRLFQVVREELGAAYYIGAGTSSYATHGYMRIVAGLNHEKLEEVMRAIRGEITKIREERVSDAELKRVQDFSIGNFMLGLETSSDLAFYYADDLVTIGKMEKPAEVIKRIKSVTPAQIQRAARAYLTPENTTFGIIGPYTQKDEARFKALIV